MRFWDTSAIIPLIIVEPRSGEMRRLLAEDTLLVTAAITPIEIASVLSRKRHARKLAAAAHHEADVTFAHLSQRWIEVAHLSVVDDALDVITRQPLRSLDALHLASAIVISGRRELLPFVTLDQRLAAAARAEGFPILP